MHRSFEKGSANRHSSYSCRHETGRNGRAAGLGGNVGIRISTARVDRFPEYSPRIRAKSGFWQISNIKIGSGQRWPELILCDLISNASHDHYCKLDASTAARLKAALGPYDRTLIVRDLFDRVAVMVQDNSYGSALVALAEEQLRPTSKEMCAQAEAKTREIVSQLANVTTRWRNSQLQQLMSWIEQAIDLQRDAERGLRMTNWIATFVHKPLLEACSPVARASLNWFAYEVAFWALTAHNHRGAVWQARERVNTLEKLTGVLCRQWQHAHLLMRGTIACAVHRSDCFEYTAAANLMERAARCDEAVATLFASTVDETVTAASSDLRAQAIGTWLQAEIFGGLVDVSRLPIARDLSARAAPRVLRLGGGRPTTSIPLPIGDCRRRLYCCSEPFGNESGDRGPQPRSYCGGPCAIGSRATSPGGFPAITLAATGCRCRFGRERA